MSVEEGCVSAAQGPIEAPAPAEGATSRATDGEARRMTAHVGGKAPDFEAAALVGGTFRNVRLSDYLGHWVVLCFYPGDFTFV